MTAFDHGEGWTGLSFRQGQYHDITFSNLDNIVTSGPKPILEVLITGGNNLPHTASLGVGSTQSALRPLKDVNFSFHYDTLVSSTLEWPDIAEGSMVCRVSIPDNGVADRVSISFARLVFADAWDQELVEQKVYHQPPTNSNRSYIEIQNVPAGSKLIDISDEANSINIGYNSTGSGIDAVIQNDAQGRALILASRRIKVLKIEPVTMRNINPSKANFLIVTHKSLRKATSNYSDVPLAYVTYRASASGGVKGS